MVRSLCLFTNIYYFFLLTICLLGALRRSSPGVGDVSDDVVRLFEHPVVTPGDGVVRVDGLYPLREHSIGVIVVFCLLTRHIGQHDGIIDLRIFFL